MPRKKFRTARRKNKADITPNNQPSRKRNLWTVVQMKSALEEYKEGKMTIGNIAKKFTRQHCMIASMAEYNMELSLDQIHIYNHMKRKLWLISHLQGYGKARKLVNITVEMVAKSKGVLRKDKISNGWWRRFIGRQPEVSLFEVQTLLHTSVWIQ